MGCLLWEVCRKLTVLKRHRTVIGKRKCSIYVYAPPCSIRRFDVKIGLLWNCQHLAYNFLDDCLWEEVLYFDENLQNILKGLHTKLCLTNALLNSYEKTYTYLVFHHFTTLRWHSDLKSFLVERRWPTYITQSIQVHAVDPIHMGPFE